MSVDPTILIKTLLPAKLEREVDVDPEPVPETQVSFLELVSPPTEKDLANDPIEPTLLLSEEVDGDISLDGDLPLAKSDETRPIAKSELLEGHRQPNANAIISSSDPVRVEPEKATKFSMKSGNHAAPQIDSREVQRPPKSRVQSGSPAAQNGRLSLSETQPDLVESHKKAQRGKTPDSLEGNTPSNTFTTLRSPPSVAELQAQSFLEQDVKRATQAPALSTVVANADRTVREKMPAADLPSRTDKRTEAQGALVSREPVTMAGAVLSEDIPDPEPQEILGQKPERTPWLNPILAMPQELIQQPVMSKEAVSFARLPNENSVTADFDIESEIVLREQAVSSVRETAIPSPSIGQAQALPDQQTARRIAQQMAVQIQLTEDGFSEIRLNPKELGHLRMQISLTESGINLHLLVERPETAELMKRHIETLTDAFKEMGHKSINLSFEQGETSQDEPSLSRQERKTDSQHSETVLVGSTSLPTPSDGLDLRI